MEERASGESSTLPGDGGRLSYSFLRWQVVIGTLLVNLPISVPTFYGNLSTYTNSYFRFVFGDGEGENQTMWMFPIYLCFSVVGFLTVDLFVVKCGLFASQIIALILYDLGIFLTYFTIQHSVGLVILSLIICGGYFAGMIFMINLIYCVKMVPFQSGIASAISTSGSGLGGLFINFLITSYINPSNLVPDVHITNQAYFSQTRILDNVPRSFLLIGVNNLVFHILGLLVMHITLTFINFHEQTSKLNCVDKEQNVKKLYSLHEVSTEGSTIYDCHKADTVGSSDIASNATADSHTENERPSFQVQDVKTDFRPLEVLQTRSFYIAWISVCVLTSGFILSLSYYKQFGQLWIQDDVFLTTIGSVASVTVLVGRIVVGALIDKVGIKRSLVLILSINSITMSFWYFTARQHRWLYFLWVQAICANTGSLYILTPMISLKLHGKTYYGTNYGLLMTGCLITSLLEPLSIPTILENGGWFWLMAVESSISLLALTLTLFIDIPIL